MGEAVFFRNLTTKGLTAINSGERYFEGYLTVQVKDKQGEVTIVDELMKVLPIWIDRGAPISDTHSNRIIGKGINYSKTIYKDTDGEEYPAIMVTGKIHKNYELDNDIWAKIKSGEYKGLSFGGATKADREPMRMKDGSIAYSLKDLEHYEVAVCRDPAVPLALITEYNTLAKAATEPICIGCYVEKDNKEAGLKAPEARNEALVYDDKTHDQPSETPLENQAKIKKGGAKGGKEAKQVDDIIREIPDEENKEDAINRHETGDISTTESRHKRHPSVGKTHKLEHAKDLIDDHIEEMKKGEDDTTEIDDEENTYNEQEALFEKTHGKKSGKTLADFREANRMHTGGTQVEKGEDWSNADGDRHGMYNQDTDEGGMGKKHTGPKRCKCGDPKCKDPKCVKKRDSVLQGYGGEQNDTGEVHWSGSGSPYPKTTSKAIITNIHSRLKNLDFILRFNKDTRTGQADEAIYVEELSKPTMAKYDGLDELTSGGKKTGKKDIVESHPDKKGTKQSTKKAIITNIHSRLKSLDFLLLGQCQQEHEGTCAEAIAEESSQETKRKHGKKQKKEAKKDGEFGGMNTGEVEWTEPRDTANSRTKRKKENVA